MEHNGNLNNLTSNVCQMMLKGFSFSANFDQEASPFLYYISLLDSPIVFSLYGLLYTMRKTKFVTSSTFDWPDSKLNNSLRDFGNSNIF